MFEGTIEPQLSAWIRHFIPGAQFGFLKGFGTADYGAAITFTIQSTLERKLSDGKRGEGLLISLDVKGAFDRCWWSQLKRKFTKKGM